MTDMQLYMNRVKRLFDANSKKKDPWKTSIVRFSESLDVVQFPFAEFLVLSGTVNGERRCLQHVERRISYPNRMYPLEFLGYFTFGNSCDIDGRHTGRVCCAHFKNEFGDDIFVNKRFHEVFGRLATNYYVNISGGYVSYCSDDETAPAFGNVCIYQPKPR